MKYFKILYGWNWGGATTYFDYGYSSGLTEEDAVRKLKPDGNKIFVEIADILQISEQTYKKKTSAIRRAKAKEEKLNRLTKILTKKIP